MLYGDGTGKLVNTFTHSASTNYVVVDDLKNFIEGQRIGVYNIEDEEYYSNAYSLVITKIDRATKTIYFDKTFGSQIDPSRFVLCMQSSYGLEITGLGKIFDDSEMLYGLSRNQYDWLRPYKKGDVGTLTDTVIQTAIDNLEDYTGSTIDFITCSSGVKRAYQEHLSTFKRNVDVMELNGGYKAISYNGIPLVSDRFVENDTMYLLNTKDFNLHQLCDWQWLENEDGRIIHQMSGKPTYSATLVKYADLICDHPGGQAKLSGITVA